MARNRKKLALLVPLAALLGLPIGGTSASAQSTDLGYSIREARAYAFRVPLRPEVIEGARRARPCDPKTDPYQCDTGRYEQKPNCPSSVDYGNRGRAPEPTGDSATEAATGGAGDSAGAGESPPESWAIALNDLLALGRLGRAGDVLEAGGLASDSYVDLSGRQTPTAHTESDAFSPNTSAYEERCDPVEGNEVPANHSHFLSRSSTGPETYHLAECFRRGCTFFGGAAFGSTAEEGRSIVHLTERGGKVVAEVKAVLKEASWGEGRFTVRLLETVITLSSAGPADSLEWSVSTTAHGAELNGNPVSLPPGRVVGGTDLQVGVAAPHVETAADGSAIQILAPGLFVAHPEQAVYFAGAELEGSTGADTVGFVPGGGPVTGVTETPTVAAPPATDEVPPPPAPEADTRGPDTETEPGSLVSVTRTPTGTLPVVLTLGLGALSLLVVLMRWMGRFQWARPLYRVQPFLALDWIYRAFVKT